MKEIDAINMHCWIRITERKTKTSKKDEMKMELENVLKILPRAASTHTHILHMLEINWHIH